MQQQDVATVFMICDVLPKDTHTCGRKYVYFQSIFVLYVLYSEGVIVDELFSQYNMVGVGTEKNKEKIES